MEEKKRQKGQLTSTLPNVQGLRLCDLTHRTPWFECRPASRHLHTHIPTHSGHSRAYPTLTATRAGGSQTSLVLFVAPSYSLDQLQALIISCPLCHFTARFSTGFLLSPAPQKRPPRRVSKSSALGSLLLLHRGLQLSKKESAESTHRSGVRWFRFLSFY